MPGKSNRNRGAYVGLLTALLIHSTKAQCSTAELMVVADIVATCCESMPAGCAVAFPATCSHTCASAVQGCLPRGAKRPLGLMIP